MPELEFGISLASLLPHTINDWWWPHGSPSNVASRLSLVYTFFQTLNLKGTKGTEWYCQPPWSRYKEDAWNAVYGLGQVIRGEYGEAMATSTLADYLFFPDPWTGDQVFKRMAGRHVCHKFGEDLESRLVEISPKLGLSIADFAQTAESGGYELCLDTAHMLEDLPRGNPFGQTINERIAAVDEIAHLVRLVHLKDTEGGHRRVVERLLRSPNLKPHIDVVAEFVPNPRMSENQAIARARRFLISAQRLFQVA